MAYKKPTPIMIDRRMKELTNSLFRVLSVNIYRNCLSCHNWNVVKEECSLYNSRPPAEVIVYSCVHWKDMADNDIPF